MNPAEQGAKLVQEWESTWGLAAKVTGASETSIGRAITALEEGRPTGKRERPKSLNPGEEEELRKRVQQAIDEKDELTYEQFKQEVYTLSFLI